MSLAHVATCEVLSAFLPAHVDMSVEELEEGSALALCTDILVLREECGSKESEWDYERLRALRDNADVTPALKSLLLRDFRFQQYSIDKDEWEPHSAHVDVLKILEERKLNHEELDYSSRKLVLVSQRMDRHSVHQRILCSLVANWNSREFIEYLEMNTRGHKKMRSGRLLQLAGSFKGECFTSAFDRRTFFLPPEAKRRRRLSRAMKVINLELSRDVHLKRPWRRSVCLRNKKTYGGLLGKNAVAMLTIVCGTGGYKKEDGCLPGPGAKSGQAFVSGGTLGMRGRPLVKSGVIG